MKKRTSFELQTLTRCQNLICNCMLESELFFMSCMMDIPDELIIYCTVYWYITINNYCYNEHNFLINILHLRFRVFINNNY